MARLSIQLMDTFRVTLDGDPVVGFASDKVRALLAYLAVEGAQPQRRETLAGLLWGGYPERSARASLRNALANLRDVIGDREAQPPYLRITPQAIQLYPEGDVWVDAAVFTQLVDGTGSPQPRRERQTDRLEAAVSLYQGSFLKGFSLADSPAFEEWALLVREQLQRRMLTALQALVEQYERRGEVARGLEYARREVELEPYPEVAQRQLMRLLAANGQRELALAQYERYCRLLKADLGVAPGQETVRLYEDIRDGQDLTGTPNLSGLSGNPLHNLPVLPTPTVGREGTLAEIETLLGDGSCRLVTLTGSGGIGKTRLAIEVARQRAGGYADGAYFVPLVGLSSSSGIVPAIAQAMGLVFDDQWDPAQQLLRALRGKEMLLVLDNYEHLLADADGPTAFVSDLLGTAVGVQVLVTSRERLNVRGEQVYVVQGMDYPAQDLAGFPPDSHRRPVGSVLRCSAVQLYLQQARRVRSGYEPSDEALAQIGRICQVVEGMPLAIVLAAAWMDVLSPGEIAGELERSIAFLRSDLRDLPERHRSMVAAFDVSWGMLSETEREAFAALSVFRGGCTREAAEAVAGADLEILRALARKSFLTRDADGRYQVHELLRQYGESRLRGRPEEWERVRDRHCAYYAEYLVQHGESFPRLGPREAPLEIDNVSIAWRRMLDQGKLAECRRAMKGLFWFDQEWAWCRARLSLLEDTIALLRRAEPSRENRIALGVALCYASRPGSGADRRYLRALAREGHQILAELDARYELAESKLIAYFAGAAEDDAHAERLLQESLSLARETGRLGAEAWALEWLGDRYFTHSIEAGSSGGEMWRQAQASYSRSLEIRRRLGYRRGEAILLAKQALSTYAEGRHAAARSLYEESLARFRAMGERDWILSCLGELGMLALTMGDYRAAEATFQEYLETAQAWGDPVSARYALCGLSDLALARGEAGKASRIRRRALQGAIEDGGLAAERILFSIAQLSAQEGKHVRAAELLALTYAIVSPSLRCVVMVCGSADLERVLRSALSPDAYAAVQERGRARDVEATLRELLAEPEEQENGCL